MNTNKPDYVVTAVPLAELKLDAKSNVRQIGRGLTDLVFVASIKTHGVKLPLTVRKNGKGYTVTDGGKRLAALEALRTAGDITGDYLVPVKVEHNSDAEAREVSLTLNFVRSEMHPVDVYRAFAALRSDKESPLDVDAIATRFGMDRKRVEQSLALGSLDDVILDAWQKEEIPDAVAKAFTLIPSKSAQVKAYNKLAKARQLHAASLVKREINSAMDTSRPMLELVGIEAYEKAGGKVTRDLFGNDHVVSDLGLLTDLADVKLNERLAELKADGWSWVTTDIPKDRWQYGSLDGKFVPSPAEKKTLDALDKKSRDAETDEEADAARDELVPLRQTIQARGFTTKQKASSGCFVVLDPDGALRVEYGRVKPEDRTDNKAKRKAARKEKPAASVTKVVEQRLDAARQAAVKLALTKHPHKDPLAKVLAAVVADQIRPGKWSYASHEIMDAFEKIAAAISPRVLEAELRRQFNAADYFKGASKTLLIAIIKEACGTVGVRMIKGGAKSRAELIKYATDNVKGWLPKELRLKK